MSAKLGSSVVQRPFASYEGGDPYIFVCYSHEDRAQVYPEIVRLNEGGFHIWYDEGIEPGSEWSETLVRQIKGCSTLLFCVTPHSVASEHCRREVNFALTHSCRVVAVHLQPTDLPDGLSLSLSNRQGILKYEHPPASYESKLDQALAPGADQPPMRRSMLNIGEWQLDVGTERLVREDEERPLDPKELSVLLHLIDRAPEIVTIDALLSRTWPDLVVTDNSLRQVIARLRRTLGDDAKRPRYIETLPRRGYRLCAAIADCAKRSDAPRSEGPRRMIEIAKSYRRRLPALAAVATVVVLALALAYWFAPGLPTQDTADRSRLALEPFTYPSNDPTLAAYATLFTNEVAHHLSRVSQRWFDITQNADDADFVAKGSLNEVGDGVRLYIEVVHTDHEIVMWSKGLDLPRTPTEDLIATRPEHLATLVYQVARLTAMSALMTESTQAVREVIAGFTETSEISQGLGGDWQAAVIHVEQAAKLDPNYILPPTLLADLYINRLGSTLRYVDTVGPMHEYTRRVLELDEDWTWLVGWVNTQDLDYEAARANYEYAARMGHDPNFMEFNYGVLALVQGQLEQAIARFNTAIELGAEQNQAAAHIFIAHAYFSRGDYAAAARTAETAVIEATGTGGYAHPQALTVAALASYQNGDPAAARSAVDTGWALFGEDYPEQFAAPLALLGDTEKARSILAGGEARWAAGEELFWSRYFWGHFYLGELDEAFVWLARAIENREGTFLPPLRRSPLLDPIRDDPRFVAAMDRLAEIEAIGTPISSVAYP